MPLPGFLAGWGLSPHLPDVPVRSREDALALFPSWLRDSDDPDGVRDAIADAAGYAWTRQASRLAAHAARANPRFATGSDLDFCGAQVGIPRAPGEEDEGYRARILADEDVATPRALLAAVDRILDGITTAQAYYYERPDDEAFVFSKADTVERGTYLDAVQPIRKPSRAYATRGRCMPRHVYLWRNRRGTRSLSSTSDTQITYQDGTVRTLRVRLDPTDDNTAADNARGHVIVGLPAFLTPGKRKPSDAWLHSKDEIDDDGELMPAARYTSIFTKATVVSRAVSGQPSGPATYPSDRSPDIVVGKIRALLASRAAFPAKFSILFDPTVT